MMGSPGWAGAGAFNNPSSAGDAAGLVLLALLEKRASADFEAAPVSYANALPADQARARKVVAYILGRGPVTGFYASSPSNSWAFHGHQSVSRFHVIRD